MLILIRTLPPLLLTPLSRCQTIVGEREALSPRLPYWIMDYIGFAGKEGQRERSRKGRREKQNEDKKEKRKKERNSIGIARYTLPTPTCHSHLCLLTQTKNPKRLSHKPSSIIGPRYIPYSVHFCIQQKSDVGDAKCRAAKALEAGEIRAWRVAGREERVLRPWGSGFGPFVEEVVRIY